MRLGRASVALLFLASAGALASSCGTGGGRAPQPNLVLIVVDTLRASAVSHLGASRPTTPQLDRLAAEGVVFEQAIAVGGNTPTVMAAMMSGRYPYFPPGSTWDAVSFGMRRFYSEPDESGLPRRLPALAGLLREAGYSTTGIVTNPYLKSIFGFDRGFSNWEEVFRPVGIPYGQAEAVLQAAERHLAAPSETPFFLYLHFMDAHGPYAPPPPWSSRFATLDPGFDLTSAWQRWDKKVDLDAPDAPALAATMRDLYDGGVAYVDDTIGGVLRLLTRVEGDRGTVIAVTSDHGEEFLEHGGTTHRGTLYEEITHVPMLVRMPDRRARRVTSLVRNFDLMPTLLAAAGIDPSAPELALDAVDLAPLLDGRAATLNLVAYAGFPPIQMLRTERYKLLRRFNGRHAFYDLAADPGERENLHQRLRSGSDRELTEAARELDRALTRIDAKLSSEGAMTQSESPVDAPTREQLKALGYIQ